MLYTLGIFTLQLLWFLHLFSCDSSLLSVLNEWGQYFLMLFLIAMWVGFAQQDTAILLDCLWSLGELLDFHALNCVLKCMLVLFVRHHAMKSENKTLRRIVLVFVSNYFQSLDPTEKFLSFHSYWFIQGLVFDILCGSLYFAFFSWFSATVTA